jgi:hypothetical protein
MTPVIARAASVGMRGGTEAHCQLKARLRGGQLAQRSQQVLQARLQFQRLPRLAGDDFHDAVDEAHAGVMRRALQKSVALQLRLKQFGDGCPVRLDLQARRAEQTLPQRHARPCLQNRLLRGDRIEFDAPLFEACGVLGRLRDDDGLLGKHGA